MQGTTEDLAGVARSLSSIDIDDDLSDTDSTGTWQPDESSLRQSTAPRSAAVNAPAGRKRGGIQNGRDLAMLLQQSPPFLLAETPPVESGPLEPTYSFASIPKYGEGRDGFSGSIDSNTDELPDATRLSSSAGIFRTFLVALRTVCRYSMITTYRDSVIHAHVHCSQIQLHLSVS